VQYWRVAALVLAGTQIPDCARAQTPVIAIRNVTIITGGTAKPIPHATIVIRGRQIESLGPTRTVRIPSRAQVIDGSGKYLIPGLIDTHVHTAGGTPNSTPTV